MKILMVSFTFAPNLDGVAVATEALMQCYLAAGWHVELLTEVTKEQRSFETWNKAVIHQFYKNSAGIPVIEGSEANRVDEFLLKGDWDIVIFQSYHYVLYNALPILNHISGRKILISHGYPGFIRYRTTRFPWGWGTMLRELLQSLNMMVWIHRFERVVYLCNYADLKGFFDHYLARLTGFRGIVVIPNGIDPENCSPDRDEFRKRIGADDSTTLFLCVANYSPRKDQAYAARAFRNAEIPNSRLVFIGSSLNSHAERFMYEDRIHTPAERLHDVIWLEKLSREVTLSAYAACDVLVLSSLHEAQPLCLLEAMRESRPWIARRAGCIHLMEGGICVETEREMTLAMRKLTSDPSLRTHMGKRGRKSLEKHYTLSGYQKAYIELAQEVTRS